MTKFYEVVDGILVDILIVFLRFTVPMVVFFFCSGAKRQIRSKKSGEPRYTTQANNI